MLKNQFKSTLACVLTQAELQEKGRTVASSLRRRSNLEDRKKQAQSQFKADIEAEETVINRESECINTGQEFREVLCHMRLNYPVAGQKTVFRDDTGELVRTVSMTGEDTQLAMDLDVPPVIDGWRENEAEDLLVSHEPLSDEQFAAEVAAVGIEDGATQDGDIEVSRVADIKWVADDILKRAPSLLPGPIGVVGGDGGTVGTGAEDSATESDTPGDAAGTDAGGGLFDGGSEEDSEGGAVDADDMFGEPVESAPVVAAAAPIIPPPVIETSKAGHSIGDKVRIGRNGDYRYGTIVKFPTRNTIWVEATDGGDSGVFLEDDSVVLVQE